MRVLGQFFILQKGLLKGGSILCVMENSMGSSIFLQNDAPKCDSFLHLFYMAVFEPKSRVMKCFANFIYFILLALPL